MQAPDRATARQRDLARDVPAGRAFRAARSHHDVVDTRPARAGALERMLHGVPAERRDVGQVDAPRQLFASGVRAVETITAVSWVERPSFMRHRLDPRRRRPERAVGLAPRREHALRRATSYSPRVSA